MILLWRTTNQFGALLLPVKAEIPQAQNSGTLALIVLCACVVVHYHKQRPRVS